MRVVIGGASGFLGSRLVARLEARGDEVLRLVRRPAAAEGELEWNPARGEIDQAALEGVDAVVNLGGVGIGDRRWNQAHKRAVVDSRLQATSTLAGALDGLARPPGLMLSASAIGFYGDRGDETLTEESAPGPPDDFLVTLVKRWEEAAIPAVEAGVPLAFIRSGLVLANSGGLMQRMLLPFKLGIGGRMGSGQQWWSWISIEDQLRAMLHVMDGRLSGAFNATAPQPVRNAEFAKSLARALHRPAVLPIPRFSLNAILGPERAQALVFASARVLPVALQASGFEFRHADLGEAWSDILASD